MQSQVLTFDELKQRNSWNVLESITRTITDLFGVVQPISKQNDLFTSNVNMYTLQCDLSVVNLTAWLGGMKTRQERVRVLEMSLKWDSSARLGLCLWNADRCYPPSIEITLYRQKIVIDHEASRLEHLTAECVFMSAHVRTHAQQPPIL